MLIFCIFLARYKGHKSAHNDTEKPQKMDANSESRQGVLAAVSANLAAMNFTLATAKAKLATARDLRIKRQAEQPEPTRHSENPFSLQ